MKSRTGKDENSQENCTSCLMSKTKKDMLRIASERKDRWYCISCLLRSLPAMMVRKGKSEDDMSLLLGIRYFLKKKGLVNDKVN